MEVGFFVILGGLFLIFVFIGSCAVSLRRVSSKDLTREYLSVGLGELRARIEKQIRNIERRELEMKERLKHIEALEKAVSEKLEDSPNQEMLARGDLKDAV
jgi:hypothetical protein